METEDSKSFPRESSASTFDFGPVAEQYDAWYETSPGLMYDQIEKDAVLRFLPSQDTEQMRFPSPHKGAAQGIGGGSLPILDLKSRGLIVPKR